MLCLPLAWAESGRWGGLQPDSCLQGRAGTPQQHFLHTAFPFQADFTGPLKGRAPGFTKEGTEARSGCLGSSTTCCLGDKAEPLPGVEAGSGHTTRPGVPAAPACPALPPAITPHRGLPARARQGGWATSGSGSALETGWQGPGRAGGRLTALPSALATSSSSEKPPLPPPWPHSWYRTTHVPGQPPPTSPPSAQHRPVPSP